MIGAQAGHEVDVNANAVEIPRAISGATRARMACIGLYVLEIYVRASTYLFYSCDTHTAALLCPAFGEAR